MTNEKTEQVASVIERNIKAARKKLIWELEDLREITDMLHKVAVDDSRHNLEFGFQSLAANGIRAETQRAKLSALIELQNDLEKVTA